MLKCTEFWEFKPLVFFKTKHSQVDGYMHMLYIYILPLYEKNIIKKTIRVVILQINAFLSPCLKDTHNK